MEPRAITHMKHSEIQHVAVRSTRKMHAPKTHLHPSNVLDI